jgi:heme-degrading monooxygenase HmoA
MKPGTTAVIFVSKRTAVDSEGYTKAAEEMGKAAERFPGYCGIHSVRGADGVGITVSYWSSDEAARAWKADAAHSAIREQGRDTWYEWYELMVAQVTRGYSWKEKS